MKAHEISKEWVARMTTLVECWNKLDGNVGELSSWVNTKVSLNSIKLILINNCYRTLLLLRANLKSPSRSWRLS